MLSYAEFIESKTQSDSMGGFEPIWLPDCLFDFQAHLTPWAIRKGRAALLADCGLGKSIMELVWGENVVRHTNKPVLLLTPLAVASQICKEGEKFGIDCFRSSDGKMPDSSKIVVSNYERLHYFDKNNFSGVICDESSRLKDDDGSTKAAVQEFMRTMPYRLLCTATAAPNDYVELGTSSECLGELGYQDMITRFFKKQTSKDHLGWGRTKYQMRAYAEKDFWRWVCSWARAIRKPSDLGFSDERFVLPPLETHEHIIHSRTKRPGFLFDLPAVGLQEQREERRRTIEERCEMAAKLMEGHDVSIGWVHLNDEGKLLTKLVPGAVEVSGNDSTEEKEEKLEAFAAGQVNKLITKPSLAGWGLNWQHCAHQIYFPSHSFEQWYQGIRRCWRFGQTRKVTVDMVASEGEKGVLGNLNRKQEQAEVMFDSLVSLMGDQLKIKRSEPFTKEASVPAWLT